MAEKEDPTVHFRVFLKESERINFKVETAKEGTTMSAKAAELIRDWLKKQQKKAEK